MFAPLATPIHCKFIVSRDRDAVSLWLDAAGRQSIPTKREQLELARMVQRGQKPDATRAELRAARRAKDRLVTGNLRLIVPIARKFLRRLQGSALSFEDLLQAGVAGLIRAVEGFDPERGYTLGTPAYWWISQAIRRTIAETDDAIKRPTHAQDVCRRWRYRPKDESGKGQSAAEFAQEWNISLEKLERELAHAARAACVSLDAPARGGSDDCEASSLLELVASESDQEAGLLAMDMQQALTRLRGVCPDELALVEELLLRGSATEVARARGVNRETVTNHLKAARARLKAVAGDQVSALLAVA